VTFTPIAIVGQACLLPGAHSPAELWRAVAGAEDLISSAPQDRWKIAKERVLCKPGEDSTDRTWSDRGGYVEGFPEIFDPEGFALPAKNILSLDPLFQWVLHTAREALRDARRDSAQEKKADLPQKNTQDFPENSRTGVIFGNLSFPSAAMSQFAECLHLQRSEGYGAQALTAAGIKTPDARNRFTSGLPALVLERALSLGMGAFALDAACASSLYAIKLACDRLQDGSADLMLAGAVNCTDDLYIHIGFSALQALSQTGQSRPFHRDADGLVPAEGCGFVALQRLEDAIREGNHIHGVLRGIGLSNDGQGQGLLVPFSNGQTRAMRLAYETSGLDPTDISLLECHATGTQLGDAIEVESTRQVFADHPDLPIGSLKSNTGHLITVAGVAALFKMTEAIRHKQRPPTLHIEDPLPSLSDSPLRLLSALEPWETQGPRRAAISAFGFGGNNAHLIVEEFLPDQLPGQTSRTGIPTQAIGRSAHGADGTHGTDDATGQREAVAGDRQQSAAKSGTSLAPRPVVPTGDIAIVGAGAQVASATSCLAFTHALFSPDSYLRANPDADPNGDPNGDLEGRISEVTVSLPGLKFPPNDLKRSLGQQVIVFEAVREAFADVLQTGASPSQQTGVTGVYVGMGADVEGTYYGMRWRMAEWAQAWGLTTEDWIDKARDAVSPRLDIAGVLGVMANIPANRINRQFDFTGPSFTVSAEEHSGFFALDIAVRALRAHELDAAVVAAVDLACNPIHKEAAKACLTADHQVPGDAAIALVLKRREDAERDGDRIYAVVPGSSIISTPAGVSDADAKEHTQNPDPTTSELRLGTGSIDLSSHFGHAHAASSLCHLFAGALALHYRRLPGGASWHAATHRRVRVESTAMEGHGEKTLSYILTEEGASPPPFLDPVPRLHVFSGANPDEVLANLDVRKESNTGPARLAIAADSPAQLESRIERAQKHLRLGAPLGEGAHFRAAPLEGDLAFVFTGAGAAYTGMGQQLLHAMPELSTSIGGMLQSHPEITAWIQDGSTPDASGYLWAASLLSQAHAHLTLDLLQLRPQAAIGYSSGESNSLFAFGVWNDMDAMFAEIAESGMMDAELFGAFHAVCRAWKDTSVEWAVWNLLVPIETVQEAIADEPHVHLAIVNSARDCVIAGDAADCARVVQHFGAGKRLQLPYNLACHVPEVREEFHEPWYKIHRRHVTPVPGVRFYSNGSGAAYTPSSDACARAITTQAENTLSFPDTIRAAYADGTRIFLEHGPRNACTGFIREILADEEILAISLDRKNHEIPQIFNALAALTAAGVPVDHTALTDRLSQGARVKPQAQPSASAQKVFSLPAHAAHMQLPSRSVPPALQFEAAEPSTCRPGNSASDMQTMPHAPSLPPTNQHPPAQPLPVKAAPPAVAVLSPPPEHIPDPAPLPAIEHSLPPALLPAIEGSHAALSSAMSTHMQRLAQQHQEFLAYQTALHQQFLAMRRQATQVLSSLAHTSAPLSLPPAQEAAIQTAPGEGNTPFPPPSQLPVPHAPPVPPVLHTGPPAQAPVSTLPGGNPAKPSVFSPPPADLSPETAPAPPRDAQIPPDSDTTQVPHPIVGTRPSEDGTRATQQPTGPRWNKQQLEIHSSGEISQLFGPLFGRQDKYTRQCRMPEPPLLLADRVTGLAAEAGVLSKGTIWTETDIEEGVWYLNDGRMPAGIMIESGQADLMLISYMGIDFLNKSERIYRLLGCTLTYKGDLPVPGETLQYEIRVNGHAQHGDVRLFFFEYDCISDGRPRLIVRHAQAGFFTDEELENTRGLLWTPEEAEDDLDPEARVDPPAIACTHSAFSKEQVAAFSEGDTFSCFGEGFEYAQTHTRPPKIQSGKLLFIDEITNFDPEGGPWGRGFMRCKTKVNPDDWYFKGHFKNDPCMPGNFMLEACLQTMSFYLSASGFTVRRDGWRFEPLQERAFELKCRGEIAPSTKEVIYELYVEEIWDGPQPTIICDVVGIMDGRPGFHAHRIGLSLVPDWPLTSLPELTADYVEPKPVFIDKNGFPFGLHSLLSCAWGKPSDAFGEMYTVFDEGSRRPARLPGPPYHFMTRITKLHGELGTYKAGTYVEVEYDIPDDVWYFQENGCQTMPFCVLIEAALQPCGWLASGVGSALLVDNELLFRNLDGTGTLTEEITRTAKVLRTRATITSLSRSAGMIIESFDVECFLDDQPVYSMQTVFGFFPVEAFDQQAGLPISEHQRELRDCPAEHTVDLTLEPARYCAGSLRLPSPMLLMLDRVSWWEEGGEAGLGTLRGEKDVDASEWFFKAHFFQDPVQPGSLGLEPLLQLLQFFMIETGMGVDLAHPRFEPIMLGTPMTWKYRGQVVPKNKLITTTVEITEQGEDEMGPYLIGKGILWCDGIRIYETSNMGMRIVSGPPPGTRAGQDAKTAEVITSGGGPSKREQKVSVPVLKDRVADRTTRKTAIQVKPETSQQPDRAASLPVFETVFDPAVDSWILDHCPTWTRPALPAMCILDEMAKAVHATGATVRGARNVRIKQWCDLEGAISLRSEIISETGDVAKVILRRHCADGQETDIAEGEILTGAYEQRPAALPALPGEKIADPYESGELFHGPAFQTLVSLVRHPTGASAVFDLSQTHLAHKVPIGIVHPVLLDSATHTIPNDQLEIWSPDIQPGKVGYPVLIQDLHFHGPPPTAGQVSCEVRFQGFMAKPDFPRFNVQWIVDGNVWAKCSLVYVCFSQGAVAKLSLADRRAFLLHKTYVEGTQFSQSSDGLTCLTQKQLNAANWMPGTVLGIFGTQDLAACAVKEHWAAEHRLHPSILPEALPLTAVNYTVQEKGEPPEREVTVRTTGPMALNLHSVLDFWREHSHTPSSWLGKDVIHCLSHKYVRRIVVPTPALRGQSALYMGNHQIQIESFLITNLLAGLTEHRVTTMAHAKHEQGWIGTLLRRLDAYPRMQPSRNIVYFDQAKPQSMLTIVQDLKEEIRQGRTSFFVHPQGTRSQSCREPVTKVSSLFLDMALDLHVPIVPIRFTGGLPVDPIKGKSEFPVGHSMQDYWIGAPIWPDELGSLLLRDRIARVLEAINTLGTRPEQEEPLPPDLDFAKRVAAWQTRTGAHEVFSTIYCLLEDLTTTGESSQETARLVAGAQAGRFVSDGSPLDNWIAGFATHLYGPRGPVVEAPKL